jgi:uncharacterized membrane protein YphA (DoxX/SURF4 family)
MRSNKLSVVLWVVQVLLAALFVFAGVMKLVMPIEEMQKGIAFPGAFLRFIGVAEALGGLGLLLPGLTKIAPLLTPLAAAGLAVIMVGAVVTTLSIGGGSQAILPAVVGVLAVLIAWGRWRAVPHRSRAVAQLQPG